MALLSAIYLGWLLIFWPGVLGEDSAAILMEVDRPEQFRSGKSVVWYYFVKATYGLTHRVEVPIAILMLLCAFFFARMLSWYWCQQRKYLCIFLLLFVCAAPHMVYFMGTLYPDAIFAVASTALLFEVWIICKERHLSPLSLLVLTLALPLAVFIRPNGILFLAPAVLATFFASGSSRYLLTTLIGIMCALVYTGTQTHRSTTQSALHSLVLFETVKLMQPRAMNDFWEQMPDMNDPWVLQGPKLSPLTVRILEDYRPKEQLLSYSDPVYWDMLVFHPNGPQLLGLSQKDYQDLSTEFLRYNLWHNLPDVVASRVNVMLSATLAQGGFPALNYAPTVLARIEAKSRMRRFALDDAELALREVHRLSYQWRWLLWSPWLGLFLVAWITYRALNKKDYAAMLVAIPALLQLMAIAAFASAGEYRYLLLFFTLPLALLPALLSTESSRRR